MYEGEYPSNSDPSRTMMPTAISTYGSIRGASLYWKKVICTMPTPGAISRTGSEGVGIADWSAAADARKIADAASVSMNKAGLLRGKGGAVHCEGHSPHSRGRSRRRIRVWGDAGRREAEHPAGRPRRPRGSRGVVQGYRDFLYNDLLVQDVLILRMWRHTRSYRGYRWSTMSRPPGTNVRKSG